MASISFVRQASASFVDLSLGHMSHPAGEALCTYTSLRFAFGAGKDIIHSCFIIGVCVASNVRAVRRMWRLNLPNFESGPLRQCSIKPLEP